MPEERPISTVKPEPPRPFSLRLSDEERSTLAQQAGAQPLGRYVRERLFAANDNTIPARRGYRQRTPIKHDAALASVLAKLGQSGVVSSLNEIARLARLGALPLSPETEAALRDACRNVAEIKSLLMQALGIRER